MPEILAHDKNGPSQQPQAAPQPQPSPAIQLLREVGLNVDALTIPPVVQIEGYMVRITIHAEGSNSPDLILAKAALRAKGGLIEEEKHDMLSRATIRITVPLNLLPEAEVNFLAKQTGEALAAAIIFEYVRLRKPRKDPVNGC